jgi:DNA-binding transcriptional MerR regulator
MFTDYSKEQINKNIETILALEYIGVHIEEVKEINNKYGIPGQLAYYFSVPETSTIEVEDETEEENKKIKSSEGLITLAKETIVGMLIDSCIDQSEEDKEFIEEVKSNTSDYFKFYAKVRTGEVWNEDLGKAAIKRIANEIESSTYREV